ncbi:PhzF family phenazine biosynthesis isomerase [Saccharomonospora iraqiensis]|uniref:PhzF family phenazine biosynthesis isomerase n=1 Tax=Saccharomonospora iraqiensis TaxID=52698 RepID=UPI000425697C|nr:PhzF family phenazine biosynthesis isomerase [Saccharomonospora iraqiensis]
MVDVVRYAAFSTDPSGGNPAGVVLDAGGLDEVRMQRIAAEVGDSETAFVTASDPAAGRYTVRYFSPVAEVAFCGHATVATAVALAERHGTGRMVFGTRAGEIEIGTEGDDTLVAGLTSVPTRSRPAFSEEVETALRALGWSPGELDARFPPHVAFGGNDHLVLAAGSRRRLSELDYDFDALGDLMRRQNWTTVQLFRFEDEHTVHARAPFPVGGVVEDPATGAAAAAFGGYLRELGWVTRPRRITVVQGEDMGRRSELQVDVAPDDPRVTVTGTATRITD